jgi:single-strand DNA-binding protein
MNVVVITGYVTADPARKETAKGVVTTFRIGSDDSPRVWVDVESWGHLAGTCAAHLARGRHVAVAGALGHAQWTDRGGERRERWFIRANRVTFLDRPTAASEDARATVSQSA